MHPASAGSASRARFTKRRLPLYELRAADPALAFARAWWRHARGDAPMPPRAAVDTPTFRLLVEAAHWLPVGPGIPERCQLGPLARPLVGLPPGEAEAAAEGLRADLVAAAAGAPVLQALAVEEGAAARRWLALVLPCASDRVRASELLVLVRRWRPTVTAAPGAGTAPGRG